jgi:hypothetical protein
LRAGTKPLNLAASVKFLLGKRDSSQGRNQYRRAAPIKVEVLSDEKLGISNQSLRTSQHSTEADFIQKKETINEQIAKLQAEVKDGNITEEIAEKLRKELQDSLRINEQNYLQSSSAEIDSINQEISKLDDDLTSLEKQRKELFEQNNELDARFRIGQLRSKEELKSKQDAVNQKVRLLDLKITKSYERINQLNDRKQAIRSFVKGIKTESQTEN